MKTERHVCISVREEHFTEADKIVTQSVRFESVDEYVSFLLYSYLSLFSDNPQTQPLPSE